VKTSEGRRVTSSTEGSRRCLMSVYPSSVNMSDLLPSLLYTVRVLDMREPLWLTCERTEAGLHRESD
jgi:hypothetical protein